MARWSQLLGFDPPQVRCWCWRCLGPAAAGGGPAPCPARCPAAGRGRTPGVMLRVNMVRSIVMVSRKTIVVNAKINKCLKLRILGLCRILCDSHV